MNGTAQLTYQFHHKGEYGAGAGVSQYFGDLNTSGRFSSPNFSASIFYLRQLNNYVGLKLVGGYSFLAASDANSPNMAEKRRNLSFNNNVYELYAAGDFNFFKFYPELPDYRFTPYVSFGLGAIFFDPYAYYRGKKVMLRDLGTEGQGSAQYPGKKKYAKTALVVPIGIGVKYNITDELNLFAQANYKFTSTDYLDDVSGTYAPDAFEKYTTGLIMQDRSTDLGPAIGVKGKQRGNSPGKDSYITIQAGVSINILEYRCPRF